MPDQKMKIRLVYIRWDGLLLKSEDFRNEFFISKKWELEDCTEKPDLLVLGTQFGKRAELFQAKLRYGMPAFIVGVTKECLRKHDFANIDFGISMRPQSQNNIYLTIIHRIPHISEPLLKQELPSIIKTNRSKEKKYFCLFLYRNSWLRLDGVRNRVKLCKLLSEYKVVDCAGESLNNTDRLQILERIQQRTAEQTIEFMSDYKFAITFENQSKKGYITEKIWNAYIAGCIPIYMGSPDIAEYFNPKTFINCHDYDNFEQVIDRVREIDNDPALYEEYMSAPIVLENSKLHSMSKKNISKAMDSMLEKVVRHREKWNSANNKYLYTAWLWSCFVIKNIYYFLRSVLKIIEGRIIRSVRSVIKPLLIKFRLHSESKFLIER